LAYAPNGVTLELYLVGLTDGLSGRCVIGVKSHDLDRRCLADPVGVTRLGGDRAYAFLSTAVAESWILDPHVLWWSGSGGAVAYPPDGGGAE
jgi:hypothetical protein